MLHGDVAVGEKIVVDDIQPHAGGVGSEADLAELLTAEVFKLGKARVHFREDPLHIPEKYLPAGVQADAVRAADEQRMAHPLLQTGDGRAQRRLGDVQALRGAGQVLQLGHDAEIVELGKIKVHIKYLPDFAV